MPTNWLSCLSIAVVYDNHGLGNFLLRRRRKMETRLFVVFMAYDKGCQMPNWQLKFNK